MSKPDDIPQDVWFAAQKAVGDSYLPTSWMIQIIQKTARAILAERERCACNIERRKGGIPERQEIAREIRDGVVIGQAGSIVAPAIRKGGAA